jgi:threonine dehydrogenase-like Zn-dependent dehydrogenase
MPGANRDNPVHCLWLEDRRLQLRDDQPAPEAAAGEAVVRVLLAGICNTDLEMVKGYYPFAGIPGHEFVGRVEEAPTAPERVGRRVVGEINVSCGTCDTCRAGRLTHCERRTVLGIKGRHGTLAEYLVLPVANLHDVPEGVGDEAACFVEPLAAALEIQEQVDVREGDRVVVIGAGKLGQLVARTLGLSARDVLVVGRDRARLQTLHDLGLRVGTAESIAPGKADLVVECTGNPEGLALAAEAVRPRGTVVLKSTYHGAASLDVSRLVVGEVTLVGSRCGPFAKALDLLAAGRVDVTSLIHARYPLADGLRAFDEAARGGVLKVLLHTT